MQNFWLNHLKTRGPSGKFISPPLRNPNDFHASEVHKNVYLK
jgi:hypothetical protein